jgi:hypothetical protein
MLHFDAPKLLIGLCSKINDTGASFYKAYSAARPFTLENVSKGNSFKNFDKALKDGHQRNQIPGFPRTQFPHKYPIID